MSRMHSNALGNRFELERLKSRQWPLLGEIRGSEKNSKNNVKSHFSEFVVMAGCLPRLKFS